MRTGEEQQEKYRVSHIIFADNCNLFASSKEEIRKMIAETTQDLRKRGLDWKEDQMELKAWGFEGKIGEFFWKLAKWSTELRKVAASQAMATMITKEADSMSAMRFRMIKPNRAFCFFCKKNSTRTKELLKGGSTRNTEKWCSLVFFTLVNIGAGTKKWLILSMAGRAGILILWVRGNGSKEVWVWNGFEPIKSGWQERDLPKEVVNPLSGWCHSEFVVCLEKIFDEKRTEQSGQLIDERYSEAC